LALRTDFDRATMSLIALNDLIARITLDPAERWDVWRNMRLAGRVPPLSAERERALREDLEQNRELLLRAIFRPNELVAHMGAAEQAIMKAYLQSNEEIAERMRIAAKDGALVYGPRKIMPFLIIFHWNRWGLGASLQVALTFFMDALLCPKGP
jgi:hypothetical protein